MVGRRTVEGVRSHVLEPKDAFLVDDEGGGRDFRTLVGRNLELELGGNGSIRVGEYGEGERLPRDFRLRDEIPGLFEIFRVDEE